MKTTEVLEELRKKNVRVPGNWAIRQSSSGVFLGFIPLDSEFQDRSARFTEIVAERLRAEKDAIRQSRLAKL